MVKKELNSQYRKQIASWRYPKEYAVYHLPSLEIMREENYRFVDDSKCFEYAVYVDEHNNNQVIGYVSSVEQEYYILLGIGVHPDRCNQGYGRKILQEAIKDNLKRYPDKVMRMKVRSWNQRAIHLYQNVGFEIMTTQSIQSPSGFDQFYIMEYRG